MVWTDSMSGLLDNGEKRQAASPARTHATPGRGAGPSGQMLGMVFPTIERLGELVRSFGPSQTKAKRGKPKQQTRKVKMFEPQPDRWRDAPMSFFKIPVCALCGSDNLERVRTEAAGDGSYSRKMICRRCSGRNLFVFELPETGSVGFADE